eukprot:745725-Hanusia_phi.AAC.2
MSDELTVIILLHMPCLRCFSLPPPSSLLPPLIVSFSSRYGRVDAAGPRDCSPEGNLPDAEAGAVSSPTPAHALPLLILLPFPPTSDSLASSEARAEQRLLRTRLLPDIFARWERELEGAAEGERQQVFYRMGLGDEEIVALSGAHTIGRAYK